MTSPESTNLQPSLTRSSLYALVWSTPLTLLCKRFGLSDVGLAKICRKHRVPIPYRGYWARVAAGQTPEQIPLPKGTDVIVDLHPGLVPAAEPAAPEDSEVAAAVATARTCSGKDLVPDHLDTAHPLVRQLAKQMKRLKADEYGRLPTSGREPPAAWVSPACLERALRVLDGIVHGAVRRGYKVTEVPGPSIQIEVAGQSLRFHIEERSKRFEVTEAERSVIKKRRPYEYVPRYRYQPEGLLSLRIDTATYNQPTTRSRWADSKLHRLESVLPDFFEALAELSVYRRRAAEQAERERIRQEAQSKLNAEHDAAARQLHELAERWDKFSKLRAIIQEIEARGLNSNRSLAGFEDWRAWAERYLANLDPLTKITLGERNYGAYWPHYL